MMQTALGRWVSVDAWEKYHADTFLKILWDLRQFDRNAEGGLGTFANATNLELIDVANLATMLVRNGYITPGNAAQSYRLTPKGVNLVAHQLREIGH